MLARLQFRKKGFCHLNRPDASQVVGAGREPYFETAEPVDRFAPVVGGRTRPLEAMRVKVSGVELRDGAEQG